MRLREGENRHYFLFEKEWSKGNESHKIKQDMKMPEKGVDVLLFHFTKLNYA